MVKRTKTQMKRMVKAIEQKSWDLVGEHKMSVKDYSAIVKITARTLNKIERK